MLYFLKLKILRYPQQQICYDKKEADDAIISKLTGKAANYFAGIINELNG